MWKRLVLSILLIVCLGEAKAAERVVTSLLIPSPLGYAQMCRSVATSELFLCKATGRESTVKLDRGLRDLLQRAKEEVDLSITYRDDKGADIWQASPRSYGDCEDYVIAYKRVLVEYGLPPEALRISVVRVSKQRFHALLLVITNKGNIVLDPLLTTIQDWQDPTFEKYLWVSTQNENLKWVAVGYNETK
jgi:predicted transglutaminase-like cysteine proteinase